VLVLLVLAAEMCCSVWVCYDFGILSLQLQLKRAQIGHDSLLSCSSFCAVCKVSLSLPKPARTPLWNEPLCVEWDVNSVHILIP